MVESITPRYTRCTQHTAAAPPAPLVYSNPACAHPRSPDLQQQSTHQHPLHSALNPNSQHSLICSHGVRGQARHMPEGIDHQTDLLPQLGLAQDNEEAAAAGTIQSAFRSRWGRTRLKMSAVAALSPGQLAKNKFLTRSRSPASRDRSPVSTNRSRRVSRHPSPSGGSGVVTRSDDSPHHSMRSPLPEGSAESTKAEKSSKAATADDCTTPSAVLRHERSRVACLSMHVSLAACVTCCQLPVSSLLVRLTGCVCFCLLLRMPLTACTTHCMYHSLPVCLAACMSHWPTCCQD